MADVLGGLGGFFGGLAQGLQMIETLRRAEEDRKLRQQQLGIETRRENREQQAQDREQALAPYLNQQQQLNKMNVTAGLPDIMREYTPPGDITDAYQMPQPNFPTFGMPDSDPGMNAPKFAQRPPMKPDEGFVPQPQGSIPRPDPDPGMQPPKFGIRTDPAAMQIPGLDTSHIAQVLQRAQRHGMWQRGQDVLTSILGEAGAVSQATQKPVAGSFKTRTGERAELPTGFNVQPDKTFSPYQLTGGSRGPDVLAQMIDDVRARIPPNALLLYDVKPVAAAAAFPEAAKDIEQLNQLMALRASLHGLPGRGDVSGVGGGGGGSAKGAAKGVAELVAQVRAEHPDWSPEQVAAEARKRAH